GIYRVPRRHQQGRDAAAVGHRRGRWRRARQLPRPGRPHDRRSAVRRRRAAARRRAPEKGPYRPHRREAAVVTDAPHEETAGPSGGDRPPQEMRLRSSRAPVTRLSRKVLLGLGAVAAVGIGGALFLALQPQHQTTGSELYNTNNRTTPDGLANLPRDYTGLPRA